LSDSRLFRIVSSAELDDIRNVGFRCSPESLQTKLFWATEEAAAWFARRLQRAGLGPTFCVEVVLSDLSDDRLTSLFLDSHDAIGVEAGDLAWFNEHIVRCGLLEADG
jgi:hypothetical protein